MSKDDAARHRKKSQRDNGRISEKSPDGKRDGSKDFAPRAAPLSRWRGFNIRTISTLVMVGGFAFIMNSDHAHMFLCILVIGIQILSFKEIVKLGYIRAKERKLPLFRTINWYFLLVTLYFSYGKGALSIYEHTMLSQSPLWGLVRYHFFFSFAFYVGGFVAFVCSLREGMYRYQFGQFAWTHMALLLVVAQSSFVINNIFEGLIWFLLPCSLIIVNDIMAYVFGFFFGRTGLIHLSPKKTWEGFIGGFFSTVIYGFFSARAMGEYDWLRCPKVDFSTVVLTCDPDKTFIPTTYHLSPVLLSFLSFLPPVVHIAPIQWHALIMAVFSSIIAPFGGFFASGFKRAFKIKDFADTIPGHGGITDRMDCQFVMGLFSYVYYLTFVRRSTRDVASILAKIVRLPESEQVHVFELLHQKLLAKGLLSADFGALAPSPDL